MFKKRGRRRVRNIANHEDGTRKNDNPMVNIQLREPTPEDFVACNQSKPERGEVKQDIKIEFLDEVETAKLLSRAEDIKGKGDDKKEFHKREKTAPAPKTGERIKIPFPPEEKVEKPAELLKEEEEIKKELKILRVMPQGEDMDVVPQIIVSFNQPMVPVTSVDDLKNIKIPVEMTPQVEGEWRWIGTTTLKFKPSHRVPKATNYNLKIKKGVKSEYGCELKETQEFKFSTVPLKMTRCFPDKKCSTDSIIFVEFNQKIDKKEVLNHMNVVGNRKGYKLVLMTPEEVEKEINKGEMKKKLRSMHSTYETFLKNSIKENCMWFKANKKLELDTTYEIKLVKNAIGGEGNRKTPVDQVLSFSTYGPMKVINTYPQKGEKTRPLSAWNIYFTNNIELEEFDEKFVTVEPKIENLQITANTAYISIQGKTKGKTKYIVTISDKLKDVYGQNLIKEEKIEFLTSSARQTLQGFFNGRVITIDPTVDEDPSFQFISVNLKKVRMVIFQVDPVEFHRSSFGGDYHFWNRTKFNYNADTPEKCVNAGKIIFDKEIDVEMVEDDIVETSFNLRKYLQHPEEKLGQIVVYIEPTKSDWKEGDFKYRPKVKTWIQCTKIGLSCHAAQGGDCYAWSTDLNKGLTLKDTKFDFIGAADGIREDYSDLMISVLSDDKGLGYSNQKQNKSLCICSKDKDKVFVRNIYTYNDPDFRYLSYIINDRNLYKPKEKVSIKGIFRKFSFEKNERKLELPPKGKQIKYSCTDTRGAKLKEGSITLDDNGSFVLEIELSDTVNLGTAYVYFSGPKISVSHHFQIQEFRTPEFNSSCNVNNDLTYIVDGVAIVNGKAEYYSGGGINGCEATWNVTQTVTNFTPKNKLGFNFAMGYSPVKDGVVQSRNFRGEEKIQGTTDTSGEHKITVDFKENKAIKYKSPVNVKADLTVMDINRQPMSSSTSFLVHPSEYYVGTKLGKYFIKEGEILPVDVIVCDTEGVVQKGVNVDISVVLRKSIQKGYKWVVVDEEVEKMSIVSEDKESKLNIKIKKGGNYHIIFCVKDKKDRANYSSRSVWVSGGVQRGPKGQNIQAAIVKLIGNKTEYKAGETAKILVSSPLEAPCSGLMVAYGCNGVIYKKRFELEKEVDTILDLAIDKNMIPNIMVKVYICGSDYRVDETGRPNKSAPKRPAYANGTLTISVSNEYHKIDVDVKPEKEIMNPGEEGTCSVSLKGVDVKNSLCSFILVDEAVLNLTGYSIPSPVDSFITRNNTGVSDYYSRADIFVRNWSSIRIQENVVRIEKCREKEKGLCFNCCSSCGRGRGRCLQRCCCCKEKKMCRRKCKKNCSKRPSALGLEVDDQEDTSSIGVRTNFCPLAAFIMDQKTDEKGTTTFKFKLPDNLTNYRCYVIATNGTYFYGIGETSIKAQLPVALRPSIPRFLNFGDKSEFTVVVQNQSFSNIDVNVAVRMTNLKLTDQKKQGLKVSIPYTKRAEIRFPVETESVGTGRFQIVASVLGTKFSDAVEKEVPIYTPSTSEAFATYGEVDGDGECVIQSVLPPSDVYSQFGGMSIETTSTAIASLTDAFLYLYNYQFDCIEQISSKMMSIFSLRDILTKFNVPKIPKKERMNSVVEDGLKKIKSAMRSDGALGFWTILSHPNIYLSIHVAHTLIRGVEDNFKMDEVLLNRSKSFCQNVETYINRYCNWYGDYSRASLCSFALYVLTQYHLNKRLSTHECDKAARQAEKLWSTHKKHLTHEGKVWLAFSLLKMSKEGRKHKIVVEVLKDIMNNVNETPETANFITSYGDKGEGKLVMLHSNRRTDAVILEFLIHAEPENKLIAKIVKGLTAHKKKGRWNSTQENIYILLSLKKYFQTYEKIEPDFVAKVWLGEDYCGENKFKGRETKTNIINVPMNYIVDDNVKEQKSKDLVLQKVGKGRLYYRLGMDYAPKNLKLKPADYGFQVERTYEGVTDKNHAVFDKEKDCWIFKAGEMIRVKLKLTNQSRRYHVALVDFIPAGCEILNPELKGVDPKAKEEQNSQRRGSKNRFGWRYWWYRPWYEHTNLRTERCEAFSSYLYCGVHEFSYLMRATSFGQYVVPPCKAEEMYAPELFGRSQSEKVIIN